MFDPLEIFLSMMALLAEMSNSIPCLNLKLTKPGCSTTAVMLCQVARGMGGKGGVRDKEENKLGRVVLFEGKEVTYTGKWNSSADGLRGDGGGKARGGTGAVFFLTIVRPSLPFSTVSRGNVLVSFTTSGANKFSLFSPPSTRTFFFMVVIFTNHNHGFFLRII